MSVNINDSLLCNLHENMIHVNDKPIHFTTDIVLPEMLKGIPTSKAHQVMWKWSAGNDCKICSYTEGLYKGELVETPLTDEDWETCIKPFADQWQAEKDRLEQEQQQTQEQYNQIQNVRTRAIAYMNNTWDSIEETASVESSLGYTIGVSEKDIKFYTARIETMEDDETVTFKDYHNIERTGVTKANFVTMRKEAYAEYLNLLNIKTEYEANINSCSTKEQVIALISQLNVFNPSLAPVTDI